MKSFTNRVVLFAASALVATTMAYGQTQLKAEVPFAFTAARTTMPAGDYQIAVDRGHGGAAIVRIRNAETSKTVLTLPLAEYSPWRVDSHPSMVFLCGRAGCSLTRIQTYDGGFKYPTDHKAGGNEHVASISLRAVNAD